MSQQPYHGPDGKQLATVLIGGSQLPAGYVDSNGGVSDSGTAQATATLTASPSASQCNALLNTIGGTSMGEAAYAYDSFAPASATGEFDESVLEFTGGRASTLIGQFGAALNGCGSFQAQEEDGSTDPAKILMDAGPKVGDESVGFQADVTLGAATIIEYGAIIRVGDALIVLENEQFSSTGPTAGGISLQALAGTVVQKLGALG